MPGSQLGTRQETIAAHSSPHSSLWIRWLQGDKWRSKWAEEAEEGRDDSAASDTRPSSSIFTRLANQPRHSGDIMITVTKELYSSPTSAELRGWKRPENIGRMPKSVPSSTDCNIELIQYLSLLDIMRDLWFWCQSSTSGFWNYNLNAAFRIHLIQFIHSCENFYSVPHWQAHGGYRYGEGLCSRVSCLLGMSEGVEGHWSQSKLFYSLWEPTYVIQFPSEVIWLQEVAWAQICLLFFL